MLISQLHLMNFRSSLNLFLHTHTHTHIKHTHTYIYIIRIVLKAFQQIPNSFDLYHNWLYHLINIILCVFVCVCSTILMYNQQISFLIVFLYFVHKQVDYDNYIIISKRVILIWWTSKSRTINDSLVRLCLLPIYLIIASLQVNPQPC